MDFNQAISYTVGLIAVEGKPSLKMIQSVTGIQAMNLSEFLRVEELGWEVLQALRGAQLPDGGELLTDTFVSPKEHTSQMGAYRVHSSSQKRVLKGQQYAVLVWHLGTQTVVVGCQEVTPERKTFEVTLELITHFLQSGIQVTGVRADGFYSKPGFLKPLQELGLELVSKPRRDSWWYLDGEKIQLKQYAESLAIGSFHYYRKQKVYAKSVIVLSSEGISYKVVFIRPRHSSHHKRWIYLISTDIELTTRQIITSYRRRWAIEVVFRDCSQNLGLKHHQGHLGSSERHTIMVFLAYNFLADRKLKEGKTIGFWKRTYSHAYKQERTSITVHLTDKRKVA